MNTPTPTGQYGVRIKAGRTPDVNADACSAMYWGETIDFTINVLGAYAVKAGAVSTTNFCPNTVITVPFTNDGLAANAGTKLTVQLSDNQGLNFKDLVTNLDGTNLKATLPKDIKAGSGYRIKIVSTSPASESVSATVLTIQPLPSAVFESKDISIQQYQSTDVKFVLTGDLPINLKLSNAQSFDFSTLTPSIKLTPNETTDYKISSVSNVCGEGVANTTTLKITVIPVLAAENPNLADAFQVFPNPSAELILVKFLNPKNTKQTLQLIDNKGVVFFEKTINGEEESISLQNIPTGMYHVRLMNGKQIMTKKVVKLER